MKKANGLAIIAALFLGIGLGLSLLPMPSARAQHQPASIPDPCFSQFTYKQSASIGVASATTTSLVAVSAGKSVYVCGGVIDIQGSATTVGSAQLEYGTGAACTSPTVLTGAMPGNINANVPTVIPLLGNGADLTTPVSNGVCIVTAGTTVGVTGYIQYVQQ